MSIHSAIEWTDATWNPVRGCSKVSAGCKNCYAETFAERFRGVKGHPFEKGFDLKLVPHKLAEPLTWRKSKRIFVNSMGDLFHEKIPKHYIKRCFEIMKQADWHTFQVLTKRAERMYAMSKDLGAYMGLKNIWLGVSVESAPYGKRIELLRKTSCKTRFLSIEPLLEDLGQLDLRKIDWVIVGGESGPKARSMQKQWVLSIQKQCRKAKVPFFFKQWGGVNKKAAGRKLNGAIYDAMPNLTF